MNPIQRLRDVLDYDPISGVLTWRVQLAPRGKVGTTAGCSANAYTSKKKRIAIRVDGELRLAHRIAWMMYYGEEPSGQVDHIDGNPLNNAISNLRLATNAQNGRNRGANLTNKSGWKGVSWDAARKKWRAQIGVDGKVVPLGRFDDIKEAAEAYIFAALEFHGEYARLE